MTTWSDLSNAQQAKLITAPAITVATGCEVLASDLTFQRDITDSLDPSQGDVAWDGNATIHRDCSVTLSEQLNWGTDLLRIYQIISGGGLSARCDLGVFCLTAPDQPLGTDPVSYAITGQDRLYLLARQVGAGYTATATTGVLAAVRQVFIDAGLTGVLIDSTAATATIPTDMAWPLIPATDASTSTVTLADGTTVDTSGPTTWLDIVNDLLALVSYRGVYCDEDGFYRCVPYADPAGRSPTFSFNADDTTLSSIDPDRTVTEDTFSAPNRWIFLWSNMPDTASVSTAPTVANGGIYIVDNLSDGPASQGARGLIWPTQISFTAASAADLIAQGDARVASDKRVITTLAAKTAPFPAAGHFDVFTVQDASLDGGAWKVEAQTWEIAFDGSNTTWDFDRIS